MPASARTSPAPATRLSAAERREQILDAAKQVVGESGIAATTIEAVARRAGITRPIVYSHFGDREGLLDALVDRASAQALDELARVLPTEVRQDGAREALLTAFSAYLDVASGDPHTWALLLIPPTGAPPLLSERVERGRAAVIEQLTRAVGGGLGTGGLSPDPELLARTLSASADEAVRLLLTDPQRFDRRRIMSFAEWLLSGLEA